QPVQQIIEIHGTSLFTTGYVLTVHIMKIPAIGDPVAVHQFFNLLIRSRSNQVGSEVRDSGKNLVGGIVVRFQIQFFDDRAEQAFGIVRVINGELGRISDVRSFDTEDSRK